MGIVVHKIQTAITDSVGFFYTGLFLIHNSSMHVCAKGGMSMEDIDKLLGLEGLRSTNVENEPGKDGK